MTNTDHVNIVLKTFKACREIDRSDDLVRRLLLGLACQVPCRAMPETGMKGNH